MEVSLEFNYGDIVKTLLDHKGDPERFRVVSVQINIDQSIAYGVTDIKGDWRWFKGYEIELIEPSPATGFKITLLR